MLVFPALVLPLTEKYGMGLVPVLALSFWMYLLFGVTALPWGLLSDRFGAKPLLLIFYTGAGFCGLAARQAASHCACLCQGSAAA